MVEKGDLIALFYSAGVNQVFVSRSQEPVKGSVCYLIFVSFYQFSWYNPRRVPHDGWQIDTGQLEGAD